MRLAGRRIRVVATLGAAVLIGAAGACNALLGNEDARLASEAGADGGPEAHSDGGHRADADARTTQDADARAADTWGPDAPMIVDARAEAADAKAEAGDAKAEAAACDGGGFLGDDSNCGRCGHDCAGGMCMGTQCQPVVLATLGASIEPRFIATDGAGTVFFTTSATVEWCSTAGCDAGAGTLDSLGGGAGAIAYSPLSYPSVDPKPGIVFWNATNQVMVSNSKIPGASMVAAEADPLTGVAVYDGLLCWTSTRNSACCVFDTVSGCSSV